MGANRSMVKHWHRQILLLINLLMRSPLNTVQILIIWQ